jgi:hypothetical protein
MQNTGLYGAIKDYCQEALGSLERSTKDSDDLPTRISEEVRVVDANSVSHSYVPKIDWSIFVIKNENVLSGLPTYSTAVSAMKADQTVASQLGVLVGTRSAARSVTAEECLRIVVSQLLGKTNNFTFDEAVFSDVYDELEQYFYTDVFQFRFFAPLDGFSMDQDKFNFDENLAIVKISNEEKERMLTRGTRPFAHVDDFMTLREFALEMLMKVPKRVGNAPQINSDEIPSEVARKRFSDILAALRLFKTGSIGFNSISAEVKNGFVLGGTSTFWPGRGRAFGGTYHLAADEIQSFFDLWTLLSEVRHLKRSRIEGAIARLGFGLERMNANDKLVDFIIAFEALLLGDVQELKYKLAMRVSHLLAKTQDERIKIFNVVSEAYKQRNAIVHGQHPKTTVSIVSEEYDFAKLVNSTEEYLRDAIKKFLSLTRTKTEKQATEMLDEKIIKSGVSR